MDGNKDEILTNSNLTNLFDWPIKVVKRKWLLSGATWIIISYPFDKVRIWHEPEGLHHKPV